MRNVELEKSNTEIELVPRMKLHKIRCRFKKYLTAEIAEHAEII